MSGQLNHVKENNMLVDGWEIKTEKCYSNKAPDFKEFVGYAIIGPLVKTVTRVDAQGLKDILPDIIYEKYKNRLTTATT